MHIYHTKLIEKLGGKCYASLLSKLAVLWQLCCDCLQRYAIFMVLVSDTKDPQYVLLTQTCNVSRFLVVIPKEFNELIHNLLHLILPNYFAKDS